MNAHVDENAAHAVYAPSSAHRWTVCTASAEALSALGEQEEGEAAAEGTAAHEEIEQVLGPYSGAGMGLWLENAKVLRDAIDGDHPAAYGIALAVDFVQQLPPGTLWIEQRVALTDQIWGRCDIAHWHEETGVLTIVDYKNGFVNVEAEENEQLRIYGAASIYTHRLAAKWIRYVVVQPNSFLPVPRVKQWGETAESLYEFANKTAAIPRGPKTFVGVGEHCRDCILFGMCEPSKDLLMHLSTMLARPAADVPSSMMARFANAKKPIEHWFESLAKAGTKRALAGDIPPGMKLVTGTTRRAWKSVDAARDLIVAAKGVQALSPPTPAQAEEMGIDISAHADKPQGAPVLALASDPRKEWVRKSAAEMFAGVPGVK